MSWQVEGGNSDRIPKEINRRRQRAEIIDVAEKQLGLVVMQLSSAHFAFPIEQVVQVLPVQPISHLPGTPKHVVGMIQVRGVVESVVDLRHFLGMTPLKKVERGQVLLLSAHGLRTGVLIDGMRDIIHLPVSAIHPPGADLSEALQEIVVGELSGQEGPVHLLNVEMILQKISDFQVTPNFG
ncbi:MAG: purine-binding chemotaxis protein CheW [Magnetococcales bacterium]|nr:purine-binding chemotaxis protein CheW [Magnetococcales bacterium]